MRINYTISRNEIEAFTRLCNFNWLTELARHSDFNSLIFLELHSKIAGFIFYLIYAAVLEVSLTVEYSRSHKTNDITSHPQTSTQPGSDPRNEMYVTKRNLIINLTFLSH